MAVIDTTRTHVPATNTFGNFLARLFSLFAAWNDKHATRRALSQLSDRELDDIGLTRADINSVGLHH